NPRVFLDVSINGGAASRMEFVLYATEAPRAAENFRAMCTGEKGGKLTFSGMRFYRIIDQFIDQAGVNGSRGLPPSLSHHLVCVEKFYLTFLRHDRAGLLSAANSGPDSNSGHFSVVVSPAPHLDGSYTIFGEVVSGHDTMMAINKLSAKESAT
ncbi:cyclophilin, partial [Emiliania huxleyi CCMP1516]|uniref:Peptidyl-prolyl cis-trans isomerase n=2 Tax=Emiliania huxleyi TaxID=2903 RepID=A0A0D3J5S6_EMIH1